MDTKALAPDSRTELAEDLSFALLLTLERLSPLERAAFILHDVFDYGFADIARTLERSEAACRKLATRARSHMRESRPQGAVTAAQSPNELTAQHAKLIAAFTAATQSGDLDALTRLLADDVRVIVDGGGKVRAAAEVLEGSDSAARFMIHATRKHEGSWWRNDFTVRLASVNGLPSLIVDAPEGPVQTASFEIEEGKVRALYVVRNPEKLRHLADIR
jgi:RNA polymerase sigma-70 factor (ECF subfamily)